jgi:hypothetical protein
MLPDSRARGNFQIRKRYCDDGSPPHKWMIIISDQARSTRPTFPDAHGISRHTCPFDQHPLSSTRVTFTSDLLTLDLDPIFERRSRPFDEVQPPLQTSDDAGIVGFLLDVIAVDPEQGTKEGHTSAASEAVQGLRGAVDKYLSLPGPSSPHHSHHPTHPQFCSPTKIPFGLRLQVGLLSK